MSSPWAKIEKPKSVNLAEIMSEEVARELQAKEDKKILNLVENREEKQTGTVVVDIPTEVLKAISDDTFESDEMIAHMLQMQFDKEYDQELKRTEEKFNGASKVSISFDNYRRTPLNADGTENNYCAGYVPRTPLNYIRTIRGSHLILSAAPDIDFESESEEEEVIDIRERKDWDRFDPLEKEIASIPACGYRMKDDGKMITKHDIVMSGRKNACKMLSFPPEFQTGDGEMFDLKLSNKVFNSLKIHSRNEQARRHKVHDKKEQATVMFGIDQHTRLSLYKMIINQLLQNVNGVISIGKEAVILHASSDPSFPAAREDWPKEFAIKVFKTVLSEFKQRDKYIKDDHRFKERLRNQTTRKSIQLWAEKEMANLERLKRAGIACPQVIKLKEHVLVMSFIGQGNQAAPKLKDAVLSDAEFIIAYEEVKKTMKLMYEEANLIHADMSEYNILWHDEQCYFIDVSQSVEPSHKNAFAFLHRDCVNITKYFGKRIPEIETPDDLFMFITGFDYGDSIALDGVRESFKMKPHLVDRLGMETSYDFDTAWEKAKADKVSVEIEVERAVSQIDLSLIEPPKA